MPDSLARELKHGYDASISYTDAEIGKVPDELDHQGLTKNTIIVGKGKVLSFNKIGNAILGGWNLAGNQSYSSGTPLAVTTSVSPLGTGNRVFITSYDNWRGVPAPRSIRAFPPIH